MKKLFNHILVPVNFNRNTQMVLEKSIAVANEFQCDLHLLYSHTPVLSIPFNSEGRSGSLPEYSNTEAEEKMNALVKKYRQCLNRDLSIHSTLTAGNWFPVIKQFIIANHIDLVIIPGHIKRFSRERQYHFNVTRLARETNCPVLTVIQNMEITHLKTIVVPINDFLPIRKLTAATYIADRFNAMIHLMGYKKNLQAKEPDDIKWVGRAYQLLRDHTHLKIHHSSTYGNSVVRNTLAYAKQVEADLIVVNPGRESIPGGWMSHLFGRYLYKKSSIPVLTIAKAAQE